MYIISKGDVKMANKRFCSIKNDYCIILNSHSVVEEAPDQDADIADIQFDFTPISELVGTQTVKTVDVLGIIYKDLGTRNILTKNGDRTLRSLILIDNSKHKDYSEDKVLGIEIGIWGDEADKIELKEGEIFGLKRCRTSEFRGSVKLNASESDERLNRELLKKVKECYVLFNWYKKDKDTINDNVVNISGPSEEGGSKIPAKLICQALHDKDEIFYCYLLVEMVRTDERSVYPSCPD